MNTEELSYLRRIPVFEELSSTDLKMIDQITTERRILRNQAVFHEGEPGEGFHFIRSGRVKIIKLSIDGREHILNILGPGDVFAEVLLFNEAPYPASAIAVEDAVVGVIRNRDLEALLASHPQLAVHVIRVMSKKLMYIQAKVKSFALADSQAKVAQTLDYLLGRYGKTSAGCQEISLEINRQDLANMAGTTRETVSRVFRTLKDDGVIEDEERRIVVRDPLRLRTYFDSSTS
jgi:CRP/FNR family transcriptional regulator